MLAKQDIILKVCEYT